MSTMKVSSPKLKLCLTPSLKKTNVVLLWLTYIDLLKNNHNHQVNTLVNLYINIPFFHVWTDLLEFALLKMAPPYHIKSLPRLW